MNTELALVKLLYNDPTQISGLAAKGFSSKFFRSENYRAVYDLILDRYSRFHSVPTNDELGKLGIEFDSEPVPHTLDHCVSVVFQTWTEKYLRQGIKAASEQLVAGNIESSLELLTKINSNLPSLENSTRSAEISETTDAFLERYHNRALNKGKIMGIEIGLPQLDKHIKGLLKQWLIVIQGRNGQFKSWLMAHMIKHQFMQGKNIAVFSCEMSREEFENRIHSLALGVQPRSIDTGELVGPEYNALHAYLEEVKNGKFGKLHIDDNPGDLTRIQLVCEQILQKHPLDIVYIDAAYGLTAPGKSDVERFGAIAKGCKLLAKKLDVPVVVSIQANRDFMKANMDNKKNNTGSGMSAYGSDGWNQYADIMWIIHRGEEMAAFHYSHLLMDKFRHAERMDSMLQINLREPVIKEVDREKALARIKGENPEAEKTATSIFAETSAVFKLKDSEIETIRNETEEDEEDAS